MCLKKNHDYAQRVKIVIEIESVTDAYTQSGLKIL
jgi:hypothetical protein